MCVHKSKWYYLGYRSKLEKCQFDHCGDQYVKFKLEAKVPRVSTSSCTTVLQCMNAVYLLMNKQDRDGATRGW